MPQPASPAATSSLDLGCSLRTTRRLSHAKTTCIALRSPPFLLSALWNCRPVVGVFCTLLAPLQLRAPGSCWLSTGSVTDINLPLNIPQAVHSPADETWHPAQAARRLHPSATSGERRSLQIPLPLLRRIQCVGIFKELLKNLPGAAGSRQALRLGGSGVRRPGLNLATSTSPPPAR